MNMICRKVLTGALRPNWMFGCVVPRRGGGSLQSAACSHLLPDTGLLETNRGINGGIIVVWWPGWTTVCEVSRLRHTHARYIYCFAAFWWTSAVKSCGSVSEGKNCQPGETINRPGATPNIGFGNMTKWISTTHTTKKQSTVEVEYGSTFVLCI